MASFFFLHLPLPPFRSLNLEAMQCGRSSFKETTSTTSKSNEENRQLLDRWISWMRLRHVKKTKALQKNSRSTKRTREQQKRMWMLKEQWICTQTTQTKLTSRLESAAICAKLSEPSSAQFDYPSFKSFSRFSLLSSPQVHKMNICWKKGNINNRGPK